MVDSMQTSAEVY